MYIVLGAMMCGIYYCYLQKIDGKTVSLDGLWIGFEKFLPSLLVTLFIVVPVVVVYLIIYVPFIVVGVMGSKLDSNEVMPMLIGAAVVDTILIVLMTCLHTLLIFAYPLIIDRNLGAWQSIVVSSKAVWKNLGGIAGMIGVAFVVVIPVSIITCGIGAYLVMPILFGGYALAYRKIFPASDAQNFNRPPSPDAYRGAGSYT